MINLKTHHKIDHFNLQIKMQIKIYLFNHSINQKLTSLIKLKRNLYLISNTINLKYHRVIIYDRINLYLIMNRDISKYKHEIVLLIYNK